MRGSLGLGAIAVAVGLFGCASGPDVVAEQNEQPASVNPFEEHAECAAGRYEGLFATGPVGDAGAPAIPLKGPIAFQLVTGRSGEFVTLKDNSVLSGSVNGGSLLFSATIGDSGKCKDGEFSTTIDEGKLGPDPDPNAPSLFGGTVEGRYSKYAHSFYGVWQIQFAGSVTRFGGGWSATLVSTAGDAGP